MVMFSKYFYQVAQFKSCIDMCHADPNHNCWRSMYENFATTIGGCTVFVLPLSLLPIVMKVRNLNVDVLKQSMRLFMDSFVGAWLISGAGLSMICLYRHLMGGFYYLTVLALPSATGAAICQPLLSDRAIYTYAHGLSAIALQISIIRGDFYILRILRNSKIAITFAFMCLNMFLMQGLKENDFGRFYWLTKPLKRKADFYEFYELSPLMDQLIPVVRSQIKCCAHTESCDQYIWNGICRFLKFGFCVEIIRNIISNYDLILRNPLKIIRERFNWNLITFLMGYVGIYRFVNCLTSRHNTYLKEEDSKTGHQLASFLSGLSFYFYPNIAILSHATITIIEIYWIKYYNQMKFISNWIPLDKIKMIIFPIVFGYVLHIRAFTPWLAPSMLKKLMHLTTNYKDALIYTRYHKCLFGLEPQFLL